MARMTTDKLIKQVLNPKFERTDDHASDVGHMAQFYRTAAPLLARKLQRALEVLRCIEDETAGADDVAIYLDEIEAMQ